MRLTPVWYAATALVVATMLASPTHAQIRSGSVQSASLWFDGKASLGDFRGITHTGTGVMTGGASIAAVRGYVEMQATSMTTDNSLRDRDMRKTLDVEKFPIIRFDLDSVTVLSETTDSARVELKGRMTIHGVTRNISIPADVKHDANKVRVTGAFDIVLPQYKITNLKRMLGALVMQELIRVGLDVTFTQTR